MKSPTAPTVLGIHNPALVPALVLAAECVGRTALIDEILSPLSSKTSRQGSSSPHALVTGSSGHGKTAALHLLRHRVLQDPKLSDRWLPLLFDEENQHVGDPAGFWLECLRMAEQTLGLKAKDSATHEALHTSRHAALEKHAREAFIALLGMARRRALLLVDRLDEMLAAVGDAEFPQRLRAFLQRQPEVCVIGTASAPLPDASVKDRAFQKLFRVLPLEGLAREEMKAAVHAMAGARHGSTWHPALPTREGYWRGLHILTSGSPRLLKMAFQLMEHGAGADLHALTTALLDACTPDFKQRIEAMSRQQQRVFDAIALAWAPVQIADISAGLRMESNQISAQIQALVDARLVAVNGGSAKRKRYQVADRLANLYCLMRFSRMGRSRLEWFLRTLNILLAPDPEAQPLESLRELSTTTRTTGEDGRLHAQLLSQAMRDPEEDALALLPDEGRKTARHLLKTEQGGASGKQQDAWGMGDLFAVEFDVVRYVMNLPAEQRSKLGYQHLSSAWWCIVAREAHKLNKSAHVEQCARKAVELSPKNAEAWGMISAMRLQSKRAQEALDAAQKFLKIASEAAQRDLAQSLILAARHLMPEQRDEAARLALQMAIQNPGDSLSIQGFWCHLRCDVEACGKILPHALGALSQDDTSIRTVAHFLALGASQTLVAAGLADQVLAVLAAAGEEGREALDTAKQAIHLRQDDNHRVNMVPERLALAEAYLAEVEKRTVEMRRTR
ncbi:MAG: hypothetical protein ACO1TE_07505 [Prosthecobacter sp.]